MRRRVLATAVLAGAAALSVHAAGDAAPDGRFSCRASAVRIVLLGIPFEPVVANPAGDPCTTAIAGGPPAGPASLLTIAGARAETNADGGATADVADVDIGLLPGLDISLHGLHSGNADGCSAVAGTPVSPLPGLRINGVEVLLPDPGAPIELNLGLVAIHLGQVQVAAHGDLTEVTSRAAVVESPLLATQVVLAETVVGKAGNPCLDVTPSAPSPPPPPPPPPIAPPNPFGPVAGIVATVSAGGCAGRPFVASVVGREIAGIALSLDGHVVRRAGAVNIASLRLDPARLRLGVHRLRAVVRFTGGARPTTSRFAFVRCGALIPGVAQAGRCLRIRVSAGRGEAVAAAAAGPGDTRLVARRLAASFTRPSTRSLCLVIPSRALGAPLRARTVRVTVRVGGRRFARGVRLV